MAPLLTRDSNDRATGQDDGGTSSHMFRDANGFHTHGGEFSSIGQDYNKNSEERNLSNYHHGNTSASHIVNLSVQCNLQAGTQNNPRKHRKKKHTITKEGVEIVGPADRLESIIPSPDLPSHSGSSSSSAGSDLSTALPQPLPLLRRPPPLQELAITSVAASDIAADPPEPIVRLPRRTLTSFLVEDSSSPDLSSGPCRPSALSRNLSPLDTSVTTVVVTDLLNYKRIEAFSPEALEGFNNKVYGDNVAERYSCLLLQEMQGYPLYQPSPEKHHPNNEGVMIGDVGIVMSSGAFETLFNVFVPEGKFPNPPHMPGWFRPQKPPGDQDIKLFDIHDDFFRSSGVEQGCSEAQSNKKFQCTEEYGALLVLPNRALLRDARNLGFFKEHATLHAEEWYQYTNHERRRDVTNGSLYFITGVVKCNNWGIATFHHQSRSQEFLEFRTERIGDPSRTTYSWMPTHGTRTLLNSNSTISLTNQCVFLRGYKITLQEELWNNMMRTITVAAPAEEKSGSFMPFMPKPGSTNNSSDHSNVSTAHANGSNSGTGTQYGQGFSDFIREENNQVTSPIHPSDIINRMLLRQMPDAMVALTHDSEWCDIISKNAGSLTNHGFGDMLYQVYEGYSCAIDHLGCVSLAKRSVFDSESNLSNPGCPAPEHTGEINSLNGSDQAFPSDVGDSTRSRSPPLQDSKDEGQNSLRPISLLHRLSGASASMPLSSPTAIFHDSWEDATPLERHISAPEANSGTYPMYSTQSSGKLVGGIQQEEVQAQKLRVSVAQPLAVPNTNTNSRRSPAAPSRHPPKVYNTLEPPAFPTHRLPIRQSPNSRSTPLPTDTNRTEQRDSIRHWADVSRTERDEEFSGKTRLPSQLNAQLNAERRDQHVTIHPLPAPYGTAQSIGGTNADRHASPPGPAHSFKVLRDVLTSERSIKEIASKPDIIDHIEALLSGDDYAERCLWIKGDNTTTAFLDLLICVIKSDGLKMREGNIRARRFLMELGSQNKALPRSLFLQDEDMRVRRGFMISYGGYTDVYRGSGRDRRLFAVKRIRKRDKEFYFGVLAWSTLSHSHLLRFEGIYRAKVDGGFFIGLVSPLMENGTLSEWRKKQGRSGHDIQRLISEVAEGLHYLHCEEVIHGDIRGSNVLLDENLHAKIADFGLIRHSDGTGTMKPSGSIHFMAPEVFSENGEDKLFKRTKKSDIYSFACLFYETYSGEIPFKNKRSLGLPGIVRSGQRPKRLQDPPLDDDKWQLITQSWDQDPQKRPNMVEIVDRMKSFLKTQQQVTYHELQDSGSEQQQIIATAGLNENGPALATDTSC